MQAGADGRAMDREGPDADLVWALRAMAHGEIKP